MDKLIQKRDDIKLKLSNNRITEIKGLETLTNLQYLSLYDNQITEIKGLDTLVNLKTLYLDFNPIIDINYLRPSVQVCIKIHLLFLLKIVDLSGLSS